MSLKMIAIFFPVLAVGCATAPHPRAPRLSMLDLHDKVSIRSELGEPDEVLDLRRSAQGCTERWAYTSGGNEVVFVDFNPLGNICDYVIGATSN